MAILTNDALDQAFSGLIINQVSLHSAWDSTQTGVNELINAPYVRQPVTFAAVNGFLVATPAEGMTTVAIFPVAAGDTVAFIGLWDATDPLNPIFKGMVPASQQGVLLFILSEDLTTIICPNAFLLFETGAVVTWKSPSVIANPLTEGTIYYVINLTTNTFNLTDVIGNDPLTFAAVGTGYLQSISPVTSGGTSTYAVASITLGSTVVLP